MLLSHPLGCASGGDDRGRLHGGVGSAHSDHGSRRQDLHHGHVHDAHDVGNHGPLHRR